MYLSRFGDNGAVKTAGALGEKKKKRWVSAKISDRRSRFSRASYSQRWKVPGPKWVTWSLHCELLLVMILDIRFWLYAR